MTSFVYQCWVHPDCKSLGEAMNNPRLVRMIGGYSNKADAERYLQQCKNRKKANFVYWMEAKND